MKIIGADTNDGLVLWPLGGFALCRPAAKGLFGDLNVSIAGTLSHILQSLLWFGFFCIISPEEEDNASDEEITYDVRWFYSELFSRFIDTAELRKHFFFLLCVKAVQLNILILCFNCIPILGKICVSSLLSCGIDQTKTGLIVGKAGMIMSLIGGIFWGIIYTQSSFNLVVFGWYFYQSWSLNRLANNERVDEHPFFTTSTQMNHDESGISLMGDDEAEIYMNYAESQTNRQPQWWKPWSKANNTSTSSSEMNAARPSWSNIDGSHSTNQFIEQPQRWKFWSNKQSSQGENDVSGLLSNQSNQRNNDTVEEDYGF